MRKAFKQIKWISFLLILFLVFGCSYSFEDQSLASFMVAPVKGDLDGRIGAAIVRTLVSNPSIDYQNHGAEKVLIVTIDKITSQAIGYRKDRRRGISIRDNILASEERRIIKAQVEIIDRKTQERLLGPVLVSAFIDLDYVDGDSLSELSFIDPSGTRQTVLTFSLGQLAPQQSAEAAANGSLYKKLAEKIVDVISTEW